MHPIALAQVTPYAWDAGHELNQEVERLARELAGRGHRVVIVAPGSSHALVRESRRRIRQGGDALFADDDDGGVRVLAVGEALPGRPRSAALPVDVARAVEELFARAALDVCHVHDPFGLTVPVAALRHSRALNVGTFHAPPERVVAAPVGRKVVERALGRLDARVTSFEADARAAAALPPRRLPRRAAGGGAARAPPGRRPRPHPLRRARGAPRAAAVPARAAPAGGRRGLGGARRRPPRPLATRRSSRCAATFPASARLAGSS